MVVDGGEVQFVSKLISESKELNKKVRIYTCMVVYKKSLFSLEKLLGQIDAASFRKTEFCQENVTRWAIAWTFYDIDLRTLPQATKKSKPLQYTIEKSNFKDVDQTKTLFESLTMDIEVITETNDKITLHILAQSNTWSRQAKRKRERENKTTTLEENSSTNIVVNGNFVSKVAEKRRYWFL